MIISAAMKKVIAIVIAVFAFQVMAADAAAQATASAAYDNARSCYVKLKSDSTKTKERGEWERCINMFEKVNAAFPKEKHGIDALYSAARLRRELYDKQRDTKDIESAIALYNRLVRENPKNSLADDSLYQIAVLRHKPLVQDDRARKALTYLVDNYPNGDMTPKAQKLLSSLGGPLKEGNGGAPSAAEAAEGEILESDEGAAADVGEAASNSSPFDADVAGPFDGALLGNLDIDEKDGSTSVSLKFNRAVAYSLEFTEQGRRTGSPPSLELVLSYARPSKALAKDFTVGSPYLDRIKLRSRLLGSGCRLIFVMAPGSTYEVVPKDSQIVVNFRRSDGSAAQTTKPGGSAVPKEGDSKKKS